MTKSIPFITLISLALLSGCADVITYSHDAQREGMRLYNEGDFADAAGAFRNSVRQNPQNYESNYWLGESYTKLQQYEQAIAAYKTARKTINLTLAGKYDEEMHQKILDGLANAIAVSDVKGNELDAAQQDADHHGTAESWILLAKIHARKGDADSAVDAYNRAALLEPRNFGVEKEYGLYLERIGQTERAAAPLKKAFSLDNQDADVAAALRRLGIVPGPTVNSEAPAASSRTGNAGNSSPIPTRPPAPASPTVEAPRD
ncbi:MAG TPA: tetratricopeptide repeat protein [Tepidisphaeraceae bacterium]|nr:tetratricopeptide repeat protein [Tepidisphaeraceae bacterium]